MDVVLKIKKKINTLNKFAIWLSTVMFVSFIDELYRVVQKRQWHVV